jgi:hypothetical protein
MLLICNLLECCASVIVSDSIQNDQTSRASELRLMEEVGDELSQRIYGLLMIFVFIR